MLLTSDQRRALVLAWLQSPVLELHISICLLGGEWRKCGWCRPVMGRMWPDVADYIKRRPKPRLRRVRMGPRKYVYRFR